MATFTKCLTCAGGHISAAGFFYIHNNAGERGNTDTTRDTPVEKDTVQRVFSDFLQSFGGHPDTQMDRTILEDPLAEKKKKQEVFSIQLKNEELVFMEPENLICDHHRSSEMKSAVSFLQEVLMEKDNKMKKYEELLKDYEKGWKAQKAQKDKRMKRVIEEYEELGMAHILEAQTILKEHLYKLKNLLKQKVEVPVDCEKGWKVKKALEEKDNRIKRVVEEYKELRMAHVLEAQTILKEYLYELKELLKQKDDTLMDYEKGWKGQKAQKDKRMKRVIDEYEELGTAHVLEAQNILKEYLYELKELLKQKDEVLMDCEKEWKAPQALEEKDNWIKRAIEEYKELGMAHVLEAQTILKEHLYELKELLKQKDDTLMSSLAKAEERAEKALESNGNLKSKNTSLVKQVRTLQEELSETHHMYEEKLKECEQEQQAHNFLKEKFKEMVKQNKEALMEHTQQAHNNLKKVDELNQWIKQKEEYFKAKDEERFRMVLDFQAQLKHENAVLMEQVQALQGTVDKLNDQYREKHRMFEEKLNEFKHKRQAQNLFKKKSDKMKQKKQVLKKQEDKNHCTLSSENKDITNTLEYKETPEGQLYENGSMFNEKLKEEECPNPSKKTAGCFFRKLWRWFKTFPKLRKKTHQ